MRAAAAFLSLLLSGFLFLDTPSAESPADTLRANLAALQKTSEGGAAERKLQKTIIGFVRKMGRTLPTPRAVRRHMARAEAFVESAKSKTGFQLAIREFRAVTLLAPWMAPAYYNLGVMQQKAGQYDAARESYRMYLFAAPNARDAANVEKQIFKLEALKEAAAAQAGERRRQDQARVQRERERQRQREQEQLRKKQQEKLKRFAKFGGLWCIESGGKKVACKYRMTVRGSQFKMVDPGDSGSAGGIAFQTSTISRGTFHPNGEITGTHAEGNSRSNRCGGRILYYTVRMEGRWTPGGRRIFLTYTTPNASGINASCQNVGSGEYGYTTRRWNFIRP